MQYGNYEPERPSGRGKVRINYGTWLLIILIGIFAFLIIRYIVQDRSREPGFEVKDVYGNPYVSMTPTPEPPRRPEAERAGLLPVFYSANISEMQVALTVQGSASDAQMETLLEASMEYGAKLTFFIDAQQLSRQRSIWATALLMGHEIECRGFTEKRAASLSAEALDAELESFEALIHAGLGEDYSVHFMRTDDLGDDEYETLHQHLASHGYKAIVRWALHNPTHFEQVAPGQVICVDLKSWDVKQLTAVMRVLSENGYSQVTCNELFDYEPNMPQGEGG